MRVLTMNSLRKLRRDYLSADLGAVEKLIARLTDEDVLSRFGLEERRAELIREIEEAQPADEMTASAALFFGGRPVQGSVGIESKFAGSALTKFQDLVSKVSAQHEGGGLGQRGVVANQAATRLHVTNIVRGSFGFMLEEINPQGTLVETSLKNAVDGATRLLSAFAEDEEDRFEAEIENIDQRVLNTARDFFELLRQDEATFRLVVGQADRSFTRDIVERASARAIATRIEDTNELLEGELSGVLPEGHMFEFRAVGERGVVRGRVDKDIPAAELALFNRQWIGVRSVASVRTRRVVHGGAVKRESLTLLALNFPPELDPQ